MNKLPDPLRQTRLGGVGTLPGRGPREPGAGLSAVPGHAVIVPRGVQSGLVDFWQREADRRRREVCQLTWLGLPLGGAQRAHELDLGTARVPLSLTDGVSHRDEGKCVSVSGPLGDPHSTLVRGMRLQPRGSGANDRQHWN